MKDIRTNHNFKLISNESEFELIQSKSRPLSKMFSVETENQIYGIDTETYLIKSGDEILGFFSICPSIYTNSKNHKFSAMKLICLYIFREYRLKGLGTEVLNDIQWSLKRLKGRKYTYLLAESFVDSCMFYLSNGFDFYQIKKGMNYNKKNIITLYKKIE